MLLSKVVANKVPPHLIFEYIVKQTIKLQSFVRMKPLREKFLLIKKGRKRIFLSTGAIRLTKSEKNRNQLSEYYNYCTWLSISPPKLVFRIGTFTQKTVQNWKAEVNLTELSLIPITNRNELKQITGPKATEFLKSLGKVC